MDPRLAAVRVLQRLFQRGRSLQDALDRVLPELGDPRDRALCQELAYGTCRWYRRLDALVGLLLQRPLRARDDDVRLLLLVGAYQLLHTAVAPHAAVSETAQAARALGKPWAVKLVNAVLRRIQRESEALTRQVDADPAAAEACPDWLQRILETDWPEDWRDILRAGNRRPPMVLRVNLARTDRGAYARRLAAAGLACRPVEGVPEALCLDKPVPVERLPSFADGEVSVQDAAAQLAAPLLDAPADSRVLDACAAPGGKTGHLFERAAGGTRIVALDNDGRRLQRVAENLERLGAGGAVDPVQGDAGEPSQWWDGQPFQRILLDAPCSGTGVIRRHPDIKWLRREADIANLQRQQRRLLDALWPLLARGGRLVYATCSVLRGENEVTVKGWLEAEPSALEVPLHLPAGRPLAAGWQILTGEREMDGFYYACIEKR